MKKTILAMAVPALLAAGSASASINLYDAEGVKVDASGAAEVQYIQYISNTSDATGTGNQDGQWRLDDGDFSVNTEVAVSEDLAAIGHFAFKFEDSTTENDELYVGFKGSDWGQVTFGRQLMLMDDAGITKDYELAVNSFGAEYTEADQVAKYVYDNGSLYAGLAFNDASDGASADDEREVYEGRLGYRFADVDARVYYQKSEENGGSALERDEYNFEIEYAGIENVGIAASYGRTSEDNGTTDTDTDYISLAADYTMGKTTYAIGFDNKDVEGDNDDVNGYYANVSYALHSNAKVYAEIGDSDDDQQDWGYVAGMEVKF
ncbi:hypothetical protein BZG72_15590 [Salinivibrio sp. PR6]|uniref:porin n=1 Tax=Salinivibrio sp. PR6 TaxID=1909485 RepID=UPI00098976DA|nr:porin [Salinivibrio sp. PR6]OOE78340.1 hypothetical protein BZG72_15590 [Salinivibrio sp. PR6]